MIITTKQCVEIMRVISQMGIKSELVKSIKTIFNLEKKRTQLMTKVNSEVKSKAEEDVIAYLNENEEIATKYNDINSEYESTMFETIFTVIEGIPRAEEQFYKLIADIKEVDINSVKGLDGAETMEIVQEIIKSKTFTSFFTLNMK